MPGAPDKVKQLVDTLKIEDAKKSPEIDRLVYNLYSLTEEETCFVGRQLKILEGE
jgi:hypothetical protein